MLRGQYTTDAAGASGRVMMARQKRKAVHINSFNKREHKIISLGLTTGQRLACLMAGDITVDSVGRAFPTALLCH